MTRVLLINPEETLPSWPTMPRAVEPLGLLYTAGAFQNAGIDVTLLDMQLGYGNRQQVFQQAAQNHFDGVGIALASQACLPDAIRVAQHIKNLCPAVPVFTGGVFATLNAPWLLENVDAIDFVVIGEAEPFVEALPENKIEWSHNPYILHRTNKETFEGRVPVPVLVKPDIKPDRSLTPMVIERGEYPSVAATRGCGGRCSFCCINSYYGGKWQPRHLDDIVDEISLLSKQFNINRIHLVDDNLFGHLREAKTWISTLTRKLAHENLSFRFKTTCRLDDLDENLIPQLFSAGFAFLKIGIETFCKKTQKIYSKSVNPDDAARKLDLLGKEGIHVSLGFINFDPYCSVSDLVANFEFLQRYPQYWNRYILRSRLTAYRGTLVEQRLREDGLAISSDIMGTQWKFHNPDAAKVYQRFEHLLHKELLDMERQLYFYQKSMIRKGQTPPGLGKWERILADCWQDLFKNALFNTTATRDTRLKLKDAADGIKEYCKNE